MWNEILENKLPTPRSDYIGGSRLAPWLTIREIWANYCDYWHLFPDYRIVGEPIGKVDI
jgi:hypothetical protein